MSVSGADIVAYAREQIGDPYVFGATGPNRFDCSGLVEYVYKHFGVKTPRIAADQANFGTAVQWGKMQPGDLIFFNWSGGSRAEHVGIYSGNGKMIEAPHTGDHVKEIPLNSYLRANSIGVRRFPGVTGGPADSSSRLGDDLKAVGAGLGGLNPASGLTGALSSIAGGVSDIASAATSIGKVGEAVMKLFLPSTIMRAAAALFGTIFVLIGIFFLTREARQ